GVESAWESLDHDGAAAALGARLHHALQGDEERLLEQAFDDYRAFTRARAAQLEAAADMVITHDALAAGLVEARPQEGVWVWRCGGDGAGGGGPSAGCLSSTMPRCSPCRRSRSGCRSRSSRSIRRSIR